MDRVFHNCFKSVLYIIKKFVNLKVPTNQKGIKHEEVVSMIALRKGLYPQPMGHAFKASGKNLRIQHDHIFSFLYYVILGV